MANVLTWYVVVVGIQDASCADRPHMPRDSVDTYNFLIVVKQTKPVPWVTMISQYIVQNS